MKERTSQFWRDPALPFIEARDVLDGRTISHALHSHSTFSVGAITAGQSTYINGARQRRVRKGDLVLMNPGEVHACNPLRERPWAYRMLFVDARWLATVQAQARLGDGEQLSPLAADYHRDAGLYAELNALYETLVQVSVATASKEAAASAFFTRLLASVGTRAVSPQSVEPLTLAAEFIRRECTRAVKLGEICAEVQLSPSYLIRAFKQRYGRTPHAYLVDCRLQAAREQLRQGRSIADAALASGFADQAHLQRVFKRQLAATPGHYRDQPATR